MAMSWGILNMSCDVVSVCQHLSGTDYINYFSHSCHEMPGKCHLKKSGFISAHGLREQSVHHVRGGGWLLMSVTSHLQSGGRERDMIVLHFCFPFI